MHCSWSRSSYFFKKMCRRFDSWDNPSALCFTTATSFLTYSIRPDVFAITTAYCAVLVVFIGNLQQSQLSYLAQKIRRKLLETYDGVARMLPIGAPVLSTWTCQRRLGAEMIIVFPCLDFRSCGELQGFLTSLDRHLCGVFSNFSVLYAGTGRGRGSSLGVSSKQNGWV